MHACEKGAFPEPISFSLEPGELLAFIGPNGAGKSTTIKMLTGILYGESWTQYSALREVQGTFQNLIPFPSIK